MGSLLVGVSELTVLISYRDGQPNKIRVLILLTVIGKWYQMREFQGKIPFQPFRLHFLGWKLICSRGFPSG